MFFYFELLLMLNFFEIILANFQFFTTVKLHQVLVTQC